MLISLARSWATTLSRNPRRFSTAATMARDYNVRLALTRSSQRKKSYGIAN